MVDISRVSGVDVPFKNNSSWGKYLCELHAWPDLGDRCCSGRHGAKLFIWENRGRCGANYQ